MQYLRVELWNCCRQRVLRFQCVNLRVGMFQRVVSCHRVELYMYMYVMVNGNGNGNGNEPSCGLGLLHCLLFFFKGFQRLQWTLFLNILVEWNLNTKTCCFCFVVLIVVFQVVEWFLLIQEMVFCFIYFIDFYLVFSQPFLNVVRRLF